MTRANAFGLAVLAGGVASFALAAGAAAQAQTPPSSRGFQVGDRWVCRRADAEHPQNATSADQVALNCRPVNAGIPMTNGGMIVIGTVQARAASPPPMVFAPTLSDGLTPAQIHDQWQRFVRQALQIPDVPPGGG